MARENIEMGAIPSPVKSSMPKVELTERQKWGIGVTVVTTVVLTIILVAVSYVGTEYNQWGLLVNTITGTVDKSRVLSSGFNYTGLGYGILTFPRTLQFVNLTLNSADSSGLVIILNCSFQYLIPRNSVPEIYTNFGLSGLNSQVLNLATTTVKNVAPSYTVAQYITNRTEIGQFMEATLRTALSGTTAVVIPEKGFQLLDISFPANVVTKYLNTAIQNQVNLQEQFQQMVDLTNKDTEQLVNSVLVNITIVSQNATAAGAAIIRNANSEALRIGQTATAQGLSSVLSSLNITDSADVRSFVYYIGLLGVNTTLFYGGTTPVLTGSF
jgi:regulator of protease activity HflC (stomatin/prohibitin superfamily)